MKVMVVPCVVGLVWAGIRNEESVVEVERVSCFRGQRDTL